MDEGDGLTDQRATAPFIGGFVLGPGAERVFVFKVIYGMACNACLSPPRTPALASVPCGTLLTLRNLTMDIRIASLAMDGTIIGNPSAAPEIREPVLGPVPLTITVTCLSPTG